MQNTAIENITETQKNELCAIVKKWANIKGDYCDTLLQGIAHYKCDSGIQTDAYSLADVLYIKKNATKECYDEDGYETDYYYGEWLNKHEDNLQFVIADFEMYKFAEKHNFVDEDVYNLATEIEEEGGVA